MKPTYATRKLKTNDPRVVNKYLNNLNDLLSQHRLIQRSQQLFEAVQGEMTKQQQIEFENIDKLKIQAMKETEKNCRKLKIGEISWSPKL